jgi:hypothetical protein
MVFVTYTTHTKSLDPMYFAKLSIHVVYSTLYIYVIIHRCNGQSISYMCVVFEIDVYVHKCARPYKRVGGKQNVANIERKRVLLFSSLINKIYHIGQRQHQQSNGTNHVRHRVCG